MNGEKIRTNPPFKYLAYSITEHLGPAKGIKIWIELFRTFPNERDISVMIT